MGWGEEIITEQKMMGWGDGGMGGQEEVSMPRGRLKINCCDNNREKEMGGGGGGGEKGELSSNLIDGNKKKKHPTYLPYVLTL